MQSLGFASSRSIKIWTSLHQKIEKRISKTVCTLRNQTKVGQLQILIHNSRIYGIDPLLCHGISWGEPVMRIFAQDSS
jgi:hypothetical protein